MCDDFSISFGGEFVAFFDELSLQRDIVLDDSIVYDHDSPGAIAMGMRVLFGGAAVSSPAGVADAVGSVQRLEADDFFEITQLALGATDLETVAVAAHGDAGGVVAAIFQATQPFNDDRDHALLTDVPHNATHAQLPCQFILVRGIKPIAHLLRNSLTPRQKSRK